ncbi:DUF6789 family protein [Haloarcula nitratireducens]|uniref:Uncharacterized protein n=1 Tax=Haloarcula nitratireducens TaxID=2487749 RepID=A0AAW4PFB0_9EURY|nr:DUF6789 family protein [Halomicroarcula nitratireducens]MBX0296747.1 hypothetical protein [Halomicroarcula nitratireducens]
MRKLWRTLVSGVVSTVIMMFLLLLIDIQTRARLLLFETLARLFGLPGRVGLGFLVAVFFGVVVWPALFVAAEPYLPPEGDEAVSGMLFATALWVGFLLIGTAEIPLFLFPFYAAVTLITHLVYGFVLGLVYGWEPLAANRSSMGQRMNGGEG